MSKLEASEELSDSSDSYQNEIVSWRIDENHICYGMSDTAILMDTDTKYVNASLLCSDKKVSFTEWRKLPDTLGAINAISDIYYEAPIIKKSGDKSIRGKYIHPRLVPCLGMWLGPICFLRLSEIMEHHNYEIAENEQDNIIDHMNGKIMRLKTKINSLQLKKTIGPGKDEYVTDGSRNMLVIVKLNAHRKSSKSRTFEYMAIRVMKKYYPYRIATLKKKYPESEIIVKIKNTPNSTTLWNYIKNSLGPNIISCGVKFNRNYGYSQKELVKNIRIIAGISSKI